MGDQNTAVAKGDSESDEYQHHGNAGHNISIQQWNIVQRKKKPLCGLVHAVYCNAGQSTDHRGDQGAEKRNGKRVHQRRCV